MPGPHHTDIQRHAADIMAALPVPAGYPATGRAWPSAKVVQAVRKVGWPVETVTALLPSATAASYAVHKPSVRQPVSVAPRAWLEELARRLGVPLADVCRGLIADDE